MQTLPDEQRVRAQEAGAKGFFSKGVPLVTLAAAIRAVADGQHRSLSTTRPVTSSWRPTARPVSTPERLR